MIYKQGYGLERKGTWKRGIWDFCSRNLHVTQKRNIISYN